MSFMTGVKLAAKHGRFILQKNTPKILTFFGIGGFIATAVTTGTAAVNAKDILDEKDDRIQKAESEAEVKEIKKDTNVKLIKTFAVPVGLAAGSTAMILAGQGIMGKRAAAALASAYEANKKLHITEKVLDGYREKYSEDFGKEEDAKFYRELINENSPIPEESGKHHKQVLGKSTDIRPNTVSPDGTYEWLFASETCGTIHGCGVWRDDAQTNLAYLTRAQDQFAVDMLMKKGWLLINDILDMFGADHTSYGATHGWYIDPETGEIPTISFGMNDYAHNPGLYNFISGSEPNVWLRFNARPEPITDVIDKINAKRYYKRRLDVRAQRLPH